MEAIGQFAELEGNPLHISIRGAMGQISGPDRAAVAAYLCAGVGVVDVMEATADPLNPGKFINGGPSLLTDGKWAWRLDLVHYVERYGVGLPAQFLADVAAWRGNPLVATEKQRAATMSVFGWTQPDVQRTAELER